MGDRGTVCSAVAVTDGTERRTAFDKRETHELRKAPSLVPSEMSEPQGKVSMGSLLESRVLEDHQGTINQKEEVGNAPWRSCFTSCRRSMSTAHAGQSSWRII